MASKDREDDDLGRLKRLGFNTLAECLLSVPKGYSDFTKPLAIVKPEHCGAKRYLVLRLERKTGFDDRKLPTTQWRSVVRVQLDCRDARGTQVKASVFGNVWPWLDIHPEAVLHLFGDLVVSDFDGKIQILSPTTVPEEYRGRIAATYKGKSGQVSGEALANGVKRALGRLDEAEVLLLAQAGLRNEEFTALTGLSEGRTLLSRIHSPKSVKEGLAAIDMARTLSLESVVRRSASAKSRPPVTKSAVTINRDLLAELVADLPFPLTGDQKTAITEIVNDLRSAYPMRRLLSGDVGTGKSITFMLPAVVSYDAGAEVAILAPSLLVAAQIAKELRQTFPGLPVCEVLAGGKLMEGIAVGTTALISAARKAKKTFGLVIVDEQHKFSVDQKAALVSKHTNVLEATATAIPRTLALVNFGGMDVSILRENPVVKKIVTRLTRQEDTLRVHKFVAEAVNRGGQVAIVYPIVNASAKKEPKATVSDDINKPAKPIKVTPELVNVIAAGRLWEESFPGRVGVLHGGMSPDEKKDVIQAVHDKKFDILVSSTVIEVGVTLPSLRVMVVMNPERHGLSQLHQLRGRVARKGGHGYMFLHATGELEPEVEDRLQVLVECSDGFTLAERDMDMRGFGDVEDDSQSQTGTTRTLFWGVNLTHKELEAASTRMGIRAAEPAAAPVRAPRSRAMTPR